MSHSPWTLYDKGCTPFVAKNHTLKMINQLVPLDGDCLVQPNSTKSRFRLLGPGSMPLIVGPEQQLQPLRAQPTGEDGYAQAKRYVNNMAEAPEFFFQPSLDAPEGLYDLVLAGRDMLYLAKASNGRLVLTSNSTGADVKDIDGQSAVTSIFTVDCDGRIGVMHEGISYSWNINADGRGTSFTTGAHSSDSTMIAFSSDAFGTSDDNHLELRSLVKRDTVRCVPPARAFTRENARAPSANGCGSKASHHIVPELWFHNCCNDHDYCYDNCNENSCDHCNDLFYTCMKHRCASGNIFKKAICYPAAGLYYEAVKGKFGCPYFAKYTHERCDCSVIVKRNAEPTPAPMRR